MVSSICCAADNSFDDFHQSLEKIDLIQRPTCSTPEFQAKALEVMQTYLENMPVSSSLSQRNKKLRIAGLKDFEQVKVSDFKVEDNYAAASALLMIKINKKIDEQDILLCRQAGVKDPVYIITYPYMDNFRANIVNLDKNQPDFEAISFIYP